MALHGHRSASAASAGLAGTNLTRAGDYNQRVVLQAIRARGEITRGELADITGLTHASVINISRRLIADGIVSDLGKTTGTKGQPAMRLAVNPDGAYALGLNIDREHMTLVVMDLAGRVRERIYTDKHFALPGEVVDFLKVSIETILKKRLVPKTRLIGLGLAIPEQLSGVQVSERPDAYDQWSSLNVVSAFSEQLKLPVFAENDATSAAIGELQFGGGMTHKSFVYTLISAGIGCGLIINGQPYAGGLAHAGEVGNIPITPRDGKARILWNAVSLYALYDKLHESGISVSNPEQLDPANPPMVEAIKAWVDEAVQAMFEPFLGISYLLSPQMHFIGGQLPGFIVEMLCDQLNSRLDALASKFPLARFRRATTAVDAAAMGAAVMVFQNRLLPRPEVLMKV